MVNEPSFILNPNKGGMNWGYCRADSAPLSVRYFSIIETPSLKGSGTSSTIQVKLYGDKAVSDVVTLSEHGFEAGVKKVQFKAKDVGELQKIKVNIIIIKFIIYS